MALFLIILSAAGVLAMRGQMMLLRLATPIIGYYRLITRYYLGEFLIIWAVVGWSLLSLVRGFEPRDPAVVFRVAEYLS